MEAYHPFRSEAAKQAYLAFYDERAQQWPVASETHMVDTSFGDTFVRVQGPIDGPKLVLLPGDSENSLSWIPLIEMLSAEHRTYVPDHIYDNGRSVYTMEPRSPNDFVQWLDELFVAFELEHLCVVGYSYGGWQAALYALAHPHRLEKLVLLAPSATVLPPPIGLLIRAFAYYFIPLRFVTQKYLYWYGPDAVRNIQTRSCIDEMIEEIMLARKCFKRRKFVPPTVLTDREWHQLNVPTLFLVGQNELTYSATKAVQRLAAVAPTVRALVAAEADHYLTIVRPKWVTDQILEFLNTSESPVPIEPRQPMLIRVKAIPERSGMLQPLGKSLEAGAMDAAAHKQIVSIIDDVNDMTIATVRDDGYPQATTVSYVNDGMAIYVGTSSDSQKARNIGSNNKVSLTINRTYSNWDEIEGLSLSGTAVPVTDPAEQEKVGALLFKKFPQVKDYMPPDMPPEALVIFRIEPKFVSLLDYKKGFGHTEFFEI